MRIEFGPGGPDGPAAPVSITTFTDPMMGLSYECEPTYDRLAERFGPRLSFSYAMVVLVRDVSDFMTPEELGLPPAEGVARYDARLARIYLSEEPIGGLPMNMEGFCLFDEEHRSSRPLCLAYEAVRLVCPERAEAFLRRLRRATILEGRPTTHEDVLLAVAREAGVDEGSYLRALRCGAAERALAADERLAASLGVSGLPMCLVRGVAGSALVSPLAGIDALADVVECVGSPD